MNTYLAIVEHTVSVAICLVKHRAAEGGIRLCLHQAEMSRFISCVPMIRLGGAWRDVCYGAATAQQQSKTISFVVWSASVFVLGVCVQARTTDTHTHTHTHTHTQQVSRSLKRTHRQMALNSASSCFFVCGVNFLRISSLAFSRVASFVFDPWDAPPLAPRA